MSRSLGLTVATALLCSTLALADWPVFRGDALMTGAGTAKLPDQLEVKWAFQTGEGKKTDAIESAPAVVGGVVYVSSLDKHLYALDLATGKQKWKTKLSYMKASPAVKNSRVRMISSTGINAATCCRLRNTNVATASFCDCSSASRSSA